MKRNRETAGNSSAPISFDDSIRDAIGLALLRSSVYIRAAWLDPSFIRFIEFVQFTTVLSAELQCHRKPAERP